MKSSITTLFILMLLITASCKIPLIHLKAGERLECEDWSVLPLDQIPADVADLFRNESTKEFSESRNGGKTVAFDDFIYLIEQDSVFKIELTEVIRNRHGMGAPMKNEESRLRNGHHFQYKDKWYYIRCGNLYDPMVIYLDKIYIPLQYDVYYHATKTPENVRIKVYDLK